MLVILDESGTHDGSKGIAVAGFVIEESAVEPLLRAWKEELQRHNIQALHMRDFVPPHGRHSNLELEERHSLFATLVETIHRHSLVAVGAAIEIDDFMRGTFANALAKRPDLIDSPYEWCVRQCVVQAAAWADENAPKADFEFLLEDGCRGAGKVEESFRRQQSDAEARSRFRLAGIRFVGKKDFPLTECADFLAYEMYKEVDRRVSAADRAPRRSLIALMREGDRIGRVDPCAIRAQVQRGAALIEAFVNYLPLEERFKLRCYGLRSLTDEQREEIFEAIPPYRELYRRCLATGEMGKTLADVDPKLLPPDDPELLFGLMDKTIFKNQKPFSDSESTSEDKSDDDT